MLHLVRTRIGGIMRALKLKRKLAIGVSIAGITSSLVALGLTVPAEAAATACNSRGCDLFQFGPDNGYFFTTPGYNPVRMICWTDAQWYDGTNRWFKISDIYGTGTNWTSANEVINQTRVGHC
jgi:hypothetical protein